MKCVQTLSAVAALAAAPIAAAGNVVQVVGGQTSVALDTALIEAATGLALSGVSDEVIVPGELEGSVAFAITPGSAGEPAPFSYELGAFFTTFAGAIEHTGAVFFNDNTVEVGDFTIGFDADRAGSLDGAASGFFVASTRGIEAILFDVAVPSLAVPAGDALVIAADLLVSPEFAAFLGNAALAGADVGDALVRGDTGATGADVNNDGVLDQRDITAFISSFVARAPGADFNADGVVDGQDLRAFIQTWSKYFTPRPPRGPRAGR
jgi:hypothetical protein